MCQALCWIPGTYSTVHSISWDKLLFSLELKCKLIKISLYDQKHLYHVCLLKEKVFLIPSSLGSNLKFATISVANIMEAKNLWVSVFLL